MSQVDADRFVQKVMANEAGIRAQMAALKRNDWPGAARIGKGLSLEFSIAELKGAIPDDFFMGQGKNPHVGWEK